MTFLVVSIGGFLMFFRFWYRSVECWSWFEGLPKHKTLLAQYTRNTNTSFGKARSRQKGCLISDGALFFTKPKQPSSKSGTMAMAKRPPKTFRFGQTKSKAVLANSLPSRDIGEDSRNPQLTSPRKQTHETTDREGEIIQNIKVGNPHSSIQR